MTGKYEVNDPIVLVNFGMWAEVLVSDSVRGFAPVCVCCVADWVCLKLPQVFFSIKYILLHCVVSGL